MIKSITITLHDSDIVESCPRTPFEKLSWNDFRLTHEEIVTADVIQIDSERGFRKIKNRFGPTN